MLRTKCCRLQLFTLVEVFFNGFHAPKCSGNRQILCGWYAHPGSLDKARMPTCSAAGERGEVKALSRITQASLSSLWFASPLFCPWAITIL